MDTETRMQPYPPRLAEAWPPNDTEESFSGSDLHQTTITNLRVGINEVAHFGLAGGQPVPWQATHQIALLGCVRPDGSLYRTYPDIFVYPRPFARTRSSLVIEVDRPPALIVEVLSESSYEVDLDLVRGKGYSYARAGVAEYVVLDPSGQFMATSIRAWRLANGIYHPWDPDADGRWQSAELAFAIGMEDGWGTIYSRDGRRMLREGEVEAEFARRRQTLASQQDELTNRDAEIERLQRLVDERQGLQ